MDIGSILFGLALLVGVVFYLAQPWLKPEAGPADASGPRQRLLAEQEATLSALRDLDFDHATGKITDEDHAAQRAILVAQGVAGLQEIDSLGRPTRPGDLEDDLEAAIAARRRAASAPAGFCGRCGAPASSGDRFCARCGAPLSLPAAED